VRERQFLAVVCYAVRLEILLAAAHELDCPSAYSAFDPLIDPSFGGASPSSSQLFGMGDSRSLTTCELLSLTKFLTVCRWSKATLSDKLFLCYICTVTELRPDF